MSARRGKTGTNCGGGGTGSRGGAGTAGARKMPGLGSAASRRRAAKAAKAAAPGSRAISTPYRSSKAARARKCAFLAFSRASCSRSARLAPGIRSGQSVACMYSHLTYLRVGQHRQGPRGYASCPPEAADSPRGADQAQPVARQGGPASPQTDHGDLLRGVRHDQRRRRVVLALQRGGLVRPAGCLLPRRRVRLQAWLHRGRARPEGKRTFGKERQHVCGPVDTIWDE